MGVSLQLTTSPSNCSGEGAISRSITITLTLSVGLGLEAIVSCLGLCIALSDQDLDLCVDAEILSLVASQLQSIY